MSGPGSQSPKADPEAVVVAGVRQTARKDNTASAGGGGACRACGAAHTAAPLFVCFCQMTPAQGYDSGSDSVTEVTLI